MATKSKKRNKSTKRQSIPRTTRKFQLRKQHALDNHVAEILDYARTQRREVTMIRDGVRLLWALENDDYSVLFELFPHMKRQFAFSSNGGGGLDEIKGLLEMIASQQKPPGGYLLHAETASKPKEIAAPKFDLPTFEDDPELPTIVTTHITTTDAGANLVSSLKGLYN